eukprot:5299865-Amphidinium_carterae.1
MSAMPATCQLFYWSLICSSLALICVFACFWDVTLGSLKARQSQAIAFLRKVRERSEGGIRAHNKDHDITIQTSSRRNKLHGLLRWPKVHVEKIG